MADEMSFEEQMRLNIDDKRLARKVAEAKALSAKSKKRMTKKRKSDIDRRVQDFLQMYKNN